MNNNTKSKFKQTTRHSRSKAVQESKPRNSWNKTGKVGGRLKT